VTEVFLSPFEILSLFLTVIIVRFVSINTNKKNASIKIEAFSKTVFARSANFSGTPRPCTD